LTDDANTPAVVQAAIELANEKLVEDNGRLEPFLLLENNGLREVERFTEGGIEGARARAREFDFTAGADDRCALVRVGRVGLDEDAIVVEVQDAGTDDVHVYFQRFSTKGRLLRRIKLIGDVKSAGGLKASGRRGPEG
jgi:hypothetical protein